MAKNLVLNHFVFDTRGINGGAKAPSMVNRSLHEAVILEVALGSEITWDAPLSDGSRPTRNPNGFYAACPKCGGRGVWEDERAIGDKFTDGQRPTCFDCGVKNNGWFRLPSLEQYQQSCMMWIMRMLGEGRRTAVEDMAVKEIDWISDCDNAWIGGMRFFWERVLTNVQKMDEGWPFLTEDEIKNDFMLTRADAGYRLWARLASVEEFVEDHFPRELLLILKDIMEEE